MANEFIIRNGFQSRGNGQVTGSLDVTGGITGSYTGSFTGDGSGLTGVVTASYAVTADTPNAVITASNTGNDDTIEFLKGGGGVFAVTVNNVVSSSYALTASYALNSPAGTDTNFANTNLTLNSSRFHDLNGFDLTIAGGNAGIYLDESTNTSQVGQGSNYISVDNTGIILYHSLGSRMSFLAGTTVINEAGTAANLRVESDTNDNMILVDGGLNRVGIGKNSPNSVLDVNGDTIITGSLTATGLTQGAGTNTVAIYDTGSGQFFYTSSAAIGGGGTDTNFANTDLTFTADRNHDSNGNNFVVSADGLGVTSSNAYLGYIFTSFMGSTTTSSYLGVGDTYVLATEGITVPTLDFTVEGTSSMYMIGNASFGGVNIANDALFASTVTGNVSVGKNTSNAKLDVNGNTIITGSLTVTGTASYLKSVVSASNSGGAVTVTMTEATYPAGQVIKLNCNQGTDAIQYTLPAVTEGLHYTFTGQGSTTINDGPVRFVGPAANTITGMVACSDGNDIIHTAAARVAITTMSFADGEFRNGSKVDFVCDGTNWVVTGVHGGTTSTITLS